MTSHCHTRDIEIIKMRSLYFLLIFIYGFSCLSTSIKTADNVIEPDFEKYSLVNNADLQKALNKTELNLDDIYVLAVERTEKLAIEYANLKESEAEKLRVYALFLPKISLRYQQNLLGTENTSPWIYFYGKQPIFSGLKEIYWFDKINSSIKIKEALLKYRAERLYLETGKAYYETLVTEENLKSKQISLKLLESRLKELKRRKKLGRSKESEVLSAQAQIAMLKADLQEESLKNQINRENLIFLANLPEDFKLELNIPSLAEKDAREILRQTEKADIKQRFDLIASEEMLNYAEADLSSAYSSYLPEISLQGSYYLKKGQGRVVVNQQSSAEENWNIQLSAEAPLFQGGEILSMINTAKIRLEKAKLSHLEAARLAQSELEKARLSLKSALLKVKAYEEAYNAAQKNYEVQNKEYSLGLVTNLDVLSALNELEAAKIKFHKSKTEILINTIWLKIAGGFHKEFK